VAPAVSCMDLSGDRRFPILNDEEGVACVVSVKGIIDELAVIRLMRRCSTRASTSRREIGASHRRATSRTPEFTSPFKRSS
jgi:hypothetical protein